MLSNDSVCSSSISVCPSPVSSSTTLSTSPSECSSTIRVHTSTAVACSLVCHIANLALPFLLLVCVNIPLAKSVFYSVTISLSHVYQAGPLVTGRPHDPDATNKLIVVLSCYQKILETKGIRALDLKSDQTELSVVVKPCTRWTWK
jgi:hypothetical protein